ncbi:23S rRNA (uracil(1939)-C(5))-methyltransferase RlmD [Spirosoma endbachense]|uniref:23S rRNA (Uracil(1939)-C(5))-methyltransferase RlmD n=1 Tax=Spirosoma endbachense TaxID=2666025 RepID=A0A6P1VMM7_9BACT|nr:23S rRNA (uracil(1939)-C(5))-methyltransferase RlmD [Spirosoma endbachense]QHV93834.1 23S rRNA (uracil(1939)-C(5))-methyltransferase RlmD [Spirosoma endbachense]
MRRKSHKAPERLYAVLVDAVAAEGKCIVRTEEGVIFVENPTGGPGVAPGDVVDLRITNKKKQYREAVAERIHEFSAVRTQPFCEHFGTCGGCKWQHIRYDEQLRFKHQQVVDHLTRIGKVQLPDIRPIMAAEPTQYYRNKLEFTCAEGRWITQAEVGTSQPVDPRAIGFHVPGRFDKVLPINHCYLQPDPSNAIRLAVADYAYQHDLTLYNLKVHTGFLRTLIIRTASSGQLMVTVQVAQDEPEMLNGLLSFLHTTFPQITSLNYIINTKKNDSYQDQEVINWGGKPYIEELMEAGSGPGGEPQPLTFRVGPKSFYQTNAQQAFNLYKVARDWAGLTGRERVYDLYTGTGTIALFVARQAQHVIGVEYVEASVADARVNAEINGITNTTFVAGDMRDILTDGFFDQHGRPDVVITDPPRAGMDEAVTRQLLKAAPERIVYVSCNTATQARDLGILDEGYRVADVQPVDMFPHTHHVENVALLVKR